MMKTIHKIALVFFVIVLGFNLYVLDWNLGFMADENTKFLVSAGASVLGIFGVLIMDTWGKLAKKN
ncbi:hypothetical protein [Bergeyella zoohelcum]|nr:hypothetical protein [Bergeyella zoohelcum]